MRFTKRGLELRVNTGMDWDLFPLCLCSTSCPVTIHYCYRVELGTFLSKTCWGPNPLSQSVTAFGSKCVTGVISRDKVTVGYSGSLVQCEWRSSKNGAVGGWRSRCTQGFTPKSTRDEQQRLAQRSHLGIRRQCSSMSTLISGLSPP